MALIIRIVSCNPMVLLTGSYAKYDGETLDQSKVAILNTLEPLFNDTVNELNDYNIFIDTSITTDQSLVFWSIFSGDHYSDDIQSTIDFYQNLNELNTELKGYNYRITALSNSIFCDVNDTSNECIDKKIGPAMSNNFVEPVSINSDWSNLENLITSGSDYKHDDMTVIAWFYLTGNDWQNDYEIYENISCVIFPNGNIINHDLIWIHSIKSWMVIFQVNYDDLRNIYHDIGSPFLWNNKLTKRNWFEITTNGIIYSTGLFVVCSNPNICNKYLFYDGYQGWIHYVPFEYLIAVIVIFVIVVCGLIVMCSMTGYYGYQTQTNKSIYTQPVKEQIGVMNGEEASIYGEDDTEEDEELCVKQYVIDESI